MLSAGMLIVRPSRANRRAFAGWAVTVGARTVSSHDFAVPVELFREVPADLLVGMSVDGRPLELPPGTALDTTDLAPDPAGDGVVLGVATAEGTMDLAGDGTVHAGPPPGADPPGDTSPATGDTTPESPEPAADAPPPPDAPDGPDAAAEATQGADPDEDLTCPHCGRTFSSPHGLRTHVGMSHPNEESS